MQLCDKAVAAAYPQVGHPTKVLDPLSAPLPILDEVDTHVRVGSIEGYLIDKAEAMDHPCSAVVSLIIGHTSGVLCCLYLREAIGMIAFFDAEKIAEAIGVEGLDMRGMGTQAV